MVGKRQQQILDRLPSTTNALVAHLGNPIGVKASLQTLIACGRVRQIGDWVKLAEVAADHQPTARRRASGYELTQLAQRLR